MHLASDLVLIEYVPFVFTRYLKHMSSESVKANSQLDTLQTEYSKTTVNLLDSEREKSSIKDDSLLLYLNDGKKKWLLKLRIMLEIERDPNFKMSHIPHLSLVEERERVIKKFGWLRHFVTTEPLGDFRFRMSIMSVHDPSTWTRFGVHYGLFLGALQSGCTDSQLTYWVNKGAFSLQGVVGCFGMTELGHGSNVAGIETLATYDIDNQQFIINTPNLQATKWWIGGAAHSTTHCAVYARLIVLGKDHGVKVFIVPLRDPSTYKLLPGINIGDIGKKMGRDGIDNGYIQFTNVRIPRSYMLMKHSKVSVDGKVTEPALEQLSYGALIQGRVSMVVDAANIAKKALIIAIRYACVRRQFGEPERKLLDYQIHQHRLIPLVAQALAMQFAANQVYKMFESITEKLPKADTNDPNGLKLLLNELKETHATSAGLKAFCTWNTLNIIDQSRQACGGHGYSSYNGLPGLYNDFAVQCSWEGDNTILTLQLGRYLVQCQHLRTTKQHQMPSGVGYLNKLPNILKFKHEGKSFNLNNLKVAWECVSAHAVNRAYCRYAEFVKQGKSVEEAFEETSFERFHAAKIHCTGYLYQRFFDAVIEIPTGPVKELMSKFCLLYAYASIKELGSEFLSSGYLQGKDLELASLEMSRLCAELRSEAVAVTDAFGFTVI
eukprot:NODE_668_length_5368_cov_0.471626.p1 type:complete len:663 gc:universal NODE_668_length_5368_cov_0.471626:5155-3167(-)